MNLRNRSRAEESWLAELGWREKTKRGRDGEVKTEKKGGGVGEGSVWSGRGCVWNSALLSVTSESSAVLSIHSRLSLPVCLCFPPPDLKTIAQLLFTILDKVEPSGLKFRVHVVPLGQDTCNVFHSSPFPLQIPDKFYTPFPLQISVLAKRKTQQQTWKRNEWEPNGNRLFFFCPMRSWLILETKQKKKNAPYWVNFTKTIPLSLHSTLVFSDLARYS